MLKQRSWVGLVLCVAAGLSGCGDSPAGGRASDPGKAVGESRYAIEAVVAGKRLRFAPLSETTQASAEAGGNRVQSIQVPGPNGSTSEVATGSLSSLYLLLAAAGECGAWKGYHALPGGVNPFLSAAQVTDGVWGQHNWYILAYKRDSSGRSDFASCDDVLYHQEVLLCTASKLEEVASTVKPLVWDQKHTRSLSLPQELRENAIIVPPQSARNRFIVRDLALNVLAHLGRLNLETPQTLTEPTCAEAYGQAADTAAASPLVFGVAENNVPPYFLPAVEVSTATIPALAGARLEHEAKILRESGVLLKRLITDSVYADAAGAAELRASAADPKLGNELYWGVKTPDGEAYPYNSMAHAARVLFGRLESGDILNPPILQPDLDNAPLPYTDPRCSGYHKNELLPGSTALALGPAVGEDWRARWEDLPINTPEQLTAARLLDFAGVVVSNDTTRQTDLTVVRGAVQEQLQLVAARATGITSAADPEFAYFKLSNTGKAVGGQVAALSDRDLRFGLDRTRNTFQQLARTSGATSVSAKAGLVSDANAVPSMTGVGLVVEGGMPRRDVTTDIMARLGGAQAASQCSEWFEGDGPGSDHQHVAAFQSAFVLGDVLRQRLSALRELVTDLGIEQHTRAGKLAGIGSAELRTWAGPGRVYSQRVNWEGNYQLFTIQGLLPDDVGVKQEAQIPSQLVAVYGEPWVADCAAGIRETCPADFEANHVVEPVFHATGSAVHNAHIYKGADDRLVQFAVPLGGAFAPVGVQFGTPANEFIYVVSRGGPTGAGRVLAAFKPLSSVQLTGPVTSEVISDYQRELATAVLGVDPGFSGKGLRAGMDKLSRSPNYCVEDVPHDFFVPLENELTSDSDGFEDSWKHYLDLAAIAAREADALGLELIQRNLQADEKEQAARETLGQLCGDFAAVDRVEVGKGTVSPPDDDSAVAACFDEEVHDIVFLTKDPFVGSDDVFATCHIKDLLGCPRMASDPVCGMIPGLEAAQANPIVPPAELCAEANISHAGLGHGEWQDPRIVGASVGGGTDLDCQPALDAFYAAAAGRLDAGEIARVAAEPWAAPPQLSALLGSTTLATAPPSDAAPEVHWELVLGAEPLLSTILTDRWPGCGDSLINCPTDPTLSNMYSRGTGEAGLLQMRADVESDLWTLAAVAGALPAGVFKMPIPALNFQAVSGSDPNAGPGPVLFSASQFSETTFSLLDPADGHGTVFDDARLMLHGRVSRIPYGYAQAAAQGSPAEWVRQFYARVPSGGSNRFLHVLASNSARTFPEKPSATGWLTDSAGKLGQACRQNKNTNIFLDGKYPKEVGQVCSRPNGKPLIQDRHSEPVGLFDVFDQESGGSNQKPKEVPSYGRTSAKGKMVENDPHLAALETLYRVGDPNYVHPCRHAMVDGMPQVDQTCLRDGLTVGTPGNKHEMWTRRVLSPHACTPADRVQLYLNAHATEGACDQGTELARSLALACMMRKSRGGIALTVGPPTLASVDELYKVERWIERLEQETELAMSALMLRSIPKRAIADQAAGAVGSGALKGEHGKALLSIEQGLSTLVISVQSISGEFRAVRNAVETARIALEGADIQHQSELARLTIESLNNQIRRVSAAARAVAQSFKGFNLAEGLPNQVGALAEAAAAGYEFVATFEIDEQIDRLEELAGDAKANTIAGILHNLQTGTSEHYTALQNLSESTRGAAASILQSSIEMRQVQQQAMYAAASGLGADYYYDESKQAITFPVNTVNRRLSDVTELRYRTALRNARYLAYMARLAIEQRIGQRLNGIGFGVGALDAPSKWADDVCHMTGIDYSKLAAFEVPVWEPDPGAGGTGGTGGTAGTGGTGGTGVVENTYEVEVTDFADQFIGDYVQKLGNFVEYYNIEFPSHEGDDVTVLSVRDDLLAPDGRCFRTSRNRLMFSGDLSRAPAVSGGGWVTTSCIEGDTHCLLVSSTGLDASGTAIELPDDVASGGISTLRELEIGDMGMTLEDRAGLESSSELPSGSVAQAVHLEAGGSYVLSWYDYNLQPSGAEDYQVTVLGADYLPLSAPWIGKAGAGWARHSVTVTPTESGTHWVVFKASSAGTLGNAVAIANTMLEDASESGEPSPYEHLTDSRLVLSGNCMVGSADGFRRAFQYACNETECYHELKVPMSIDTQSVADGRSKLSDKLARGNFNFRHMSVALNVVGSGVLDCSHTESPSCYATGVLDYDLTHAAFDQPVINWQGTGQLFSFGSASVRNGKALAAERYLTLPLSSTDQSLITQPQTTKPEFRGRPLSGSYSLRIYDTPALAWERVEDIQLVLNYRYWSKIRREQ